MPTMSMEDIKFTYYGNWNLDLLQLNIVVCISSTMVDTDYNRQTTFR